MKEKTWTKNDQMSEENVFEAGIYLIFEMMELRVLYKHR